MRLVCTLFAPLLCLVLVAPAVAQKDKKDDYAAKIVGTWTLAKIGGVEVPPIKGKDVPTFEFTKDGKLKVFGLEGSYKVDGGKLTMTIGKDTKEGTIKSLNADSLVITQDGNEMEFKKK